MVFEPENDTATVASELRVNDPQLEARMRWALEKTGGLRLPEGFVAAAFTQTAAILVDRHDHTIRAVSLEEGHTLWQRHLSGDASFGKIGAFNERVYTESGSVLDAATGQDAQLQDGFETPPSIVAVNQSLDGQSLFLSYVPDNADSVGPNPVIRNVVLKVGATRPLVSFDSQNAVFERLPGGGINFSGLIYDPRTNQAVRMPSDADRLFVATSEGVVAVDPIITATTPFPLKTLPWASSPTSLTGPEQVSTPPQMQTASGDAARGRCTVNQVKPLPSLATFEDFCGESAQLPPVSNQADIELWGGLSGGSGRMWFWKLPDGDGENLFLSADLRQPHSLQIDALGHASSDVLWVSRRFKARVVVAMMDTAGHLRDMFGLPPGKGFQVLGELGSQRYLCTLDEDVARKRHQPDSAVSATPNGGFHASPNDAIPEATGIPPKAESTSASTENPGGPDFCVKLER